MDNIAPEDFAIIHGDAIEVLETIYPGSVAGFIADPPYCSGGRQQAGARNTISKNVRRDEDWFLGDQMGSDTYIWWMRQIAKRCLVACQPGGYAYCFTDWRQYSTVTAAWESSGWTLRGVVVWDKDRGGAMGSFWRNNHEWIAVFVKGKPRPLPNHSFFNTWRGAKPQGGFHPTEKPIGLIEYLVSSITPVGGLIVDPFAGSGVTGIAALRQGFRFLGIELNPGYVSAARQRMLDEVTR